MMDRAPLKMMAMEKCVLILIKLQAKLFKMEVKRDLWKDPQVQALMHIN
jgi:hypothetical protein